MNGYAAHDKYLENRKLIEKEIEILKAKLAAMDIDEAKDTKNWGFAGNCGHILSEISELNYRFMSNY